MEATHDWQGKMRQLLFEIEQCPCATTQEEMSEELFMLVAANYVDIMNFPRFVGVIIAKLEDWQQESEGTAHRRIVNKFSFLFDCLLACLLFKRLRLKNDINVVFF